MRLMFETLLVIQQAFVYDVNLETTLRKLEENSEFAITQLEKNYIKVDIEKCHMIVSGTKYEHIWVKIGEDKIW